MKIMIYKLLFQQSRNVSYCFLHVLMSPFDWSKQLYNWSNCFGQRFVDSVNLENKSDNSSWSLMDIVLTVGISQKLNE